MESCAGDFSNFKRIGQEETKMQSEDRMNYKMIEGVTIEIPEHMILISAKVTMEERKDRTVTHIVRSAHAVQQRTITYKNDDSAQKSE